jgi:4-hydroxy-tetrahydrodipicolinate synthase
MRVSRDESEYGVDRKSVDWQGNFCAVITPFSESGDFSEDLFARNLELLLFEGIDGFVIAGHTGESWALDDSERFRAFEIAVDVAAGRVPVIGNASAIRTSDAIALATAAEARGLDGLLLTGPAYAMVNRREVLAHIQAVSDASRLPIMIYNIPRRTGHDLPPDLIGEIANIDNVVALKQSAPSFDDIGRVIDLCGDRLLVFAGNSAERGLPAVAVGADGFVSSVETQALGAEAISLWDLAISGRFEEARAVQRRCSQVKRFLGAFGTEPAALKVAMNHTGRPGGYTRPPILPLDEEESTKVREFMDHMVPITA